MQGSRLTLSGSAVGYGIAYRHGRLIICHVAGSPRSSCRRCWNLTPSSAPDVVCCSPGYRVRLRRTSCILTTFSANYTCFIVSGSPHRGSAMRVGTSFSAFAPDGNNETRRYSNKHRCTDDCGSSQAVVFDEWRRQQFGSFTNSECRNQSLRTKARRRLPGNFF